MNNNNPLRLATAKAIQQYRLTKLLPIYSDSELRDAVDAWMPYVESAGINPLYLTDLWIFALARHDGKGPFAATDLCSAWPEFGRRKKDAIMQDYYDELDKAQTDVARKAAELKMEKRLKDLGLTV